jgi:hypothetical protein
MARLRKHVIDIYLSIGPSPYIGVQNARVKLYLWIDRVKVIALGKRPQQTVTTGDRAKTVETTGNLVDLAVDQGPFCHESSCGVAGHSPPDD